MSLRLRILLATGLALLGGLLVVGSITYVLVTRSQLKQVDDALQRAHPPTEQLANGDPKDWPLIPSIAPGLFVAILGPSGVPLYTAPAQEAGEGSVSIETPDVDLTRRSQTVRASDGDDMRLRVDPTEGGSILVVGQSMHEVDETRRRLLAVLLTASAGAVAAGLALAWWLIGLGLRPLREVEVSAAAITDSDLADRRVPGADQPNEVGSLARALNAMLERLDTSRREREETVEDLRASEARMRQFVADASHELRTPMAATAAYAELFEKGARDRPADLERSMAGIRTETARMAELVDDLLLLARLDEHRPLVSEPVDLTEVVLTALDAARAVEPDRSFRPRIEGVITVRGDATRLRQVVDNLLANVRAHTPPETPCEVVLGERDGSAVLTVSDTGPGVTDEQLERLGDRFFRADNARTRATGGSGLGLSIAQAIVAAHGGTMAVTRTEPTGLTVTVHLPL